MASINSVSFKDWQKYFPVHGFQTMNVGILIQLAWRVPPISEKDKGSELICVVQCFWTTDHDFVDRIRCRTRDQRHWILSLQASAIMCSKQLQLNREAAGGVVDGGQLFNLIFLYLPSHQSEDIEFRWTTSTRVCIQGSFFVKVYGWAQHTICATESLPHFPSFWEDSLHNVISICLTRMSCQWVASCNALWNFVFGYVCQMFNIWICFETGLGPQLFIRMPSVKVNIALFYWSPIATSKI
jgi:hypothetical protein